MFRLLSALFLLSTSTIALAQSITLNVDVPPPIVTELELQQELAGSSATSVGGTGGSAYVTEELLPDGSFYRIKITPKSAPTYYFGRAAGDGHMESREDDLTPDVQVPRWQFFDW